MTMSGKKSKPFIPGAMFMDSLNKEPDDTLANSIDGQRPTKDDMIIQRRMDDVDRYIENQERARALRKAHRGKAESGHARSLILVAAIVLAVLVGLVAFGLLVLRIIIDQQ